MYIRFIKSRNKVVLLYISLFLQSCSYIGTNKSNIVPITRQDLLGQAVVQTGYAVQGGQPVQIKQAVQGGQIFPVVQADNAIGPLIRESNGKITGLINEGFVEGVDPNNNDIRKHLMFVFHHSLIHRQNNMPLQGRLNWFQTLANLGGQNLVWEYEIINIRNPRTGIQRSVLEFRLRNIFGVNNPQMQNNLNRARAGRAPGFLYNGALEDVEVDHLLKDNDIVIELPRTVHQQKTQLIDNFINPPGEAIIRSAANHWRRRAP